MSLTLIFQDYAAPSPERRAELDACLVENLSHPTVQAAIDLAENDYVNPVTYMHPKLKRRPQASRNTFADAVQAANDMLPPDSLVVLMNLDVHLAGDWSAVTSYVPPGSKAALCLARHETLEDGTLKPNAQLLGLAHANAQDAWAWRTPLHVQDADFTLGSIGCDNAFAARLARAGRTPLLNPMYALKIAHRDSSAREAPYRRRPEGFSGDKPEERGCALVPSMDPPEEGGGAKRAMLALMNRMSPEMQAKITMQLYNQLIKIKN